MHHKILNMKCFELHSGKWIIVQHESTLYCALFSKALLKCINVLPGEILDRICGQNLKENGETNRIQTVATTHF